MSTQKAIEQRNVVIDVLTEMMNEADERHDSFEAGLLAKLRLDIRAIPESELVEECEDTAEIRPRTRAAFEQWRALRQEAEEQGLLAQDAANVAKAAMQVGAGHIEVIDLDDVPDSEFDDEAQTKEFIIDAIMEQTEPVYGQVIDEMNDCGGCEDA